MSIHSLLLSFFISFFPVQCKRTSSLDTFFDEINVPPKKVFVLGCGCSTATEPVAEISHFWEVIHVSLPGRCGYCKVVKYVGLGKSKLIMNCVCTRRKLPNHFLFAFSIVTVHIFYVVKIFLYGNQKMKVFRKHFCHVLNNVYITFTCSSIHHTRVLLFVVRIFLFEVLNMGIF